VASPTVPEFALPERDAAESRGSKSWIAGLIVVVIAAGLLWYGFDLSDRLDAGRDDRSPTSTAGAAAIVDDPTPTPSDTPAADEAETVAPASVTVPDVVGASEADAESALSDVGLTVNLGQAQPSETIPAGAVVSQSPVGGTTVTQETVVTITLSSGPAPVDLTALNVTDIPRDDVVSELTALGLNVVLAEEGSTTVDAGNVIRVEPDDSASPGDDVTVYVSVGDRVLIPASLQGQPVDRVRSALEDFGLEIAGEIAVSTTTLESQGINPDDVGIANGDVVGIQDNDARFGGWVDSGVSVTLIYYDE